MELASGYKTTELGSVPDDWGVVSLEEVSDPRRGICYGIVQVGPFRNGGVPVLAIKNLNTDYDTNVHHCELVIEQSYVRSRVAPGDVLVSVKGTTGRVGLVPSHFRGNISRDIARLALTDSDVPEYWFQQLQSSAAQRRLGTATVGTTRLELSIGILKQVRMLRPPKHEQKAIAAALSDVDALLGALDRLIAKKRDLKLAAMQQLLTGQTRLPGFSHAWTTVTLGSLLERLANGAVYRPATRDGVPITRIETIADGTVDYTRTGLAVWDSTLEPYKLRQGDILFSHINSIDHIGKVAFVGESRPLYHGMNLLLLRAAANQNSSYLYYWLSSEPARRRMRVLAKQAVSQASINTAELRSVLLQLPHIEEQHAIAAVLADMDAELTTLEKRRDKSRLLKQGMMQELLTGRTRLS